MLFVSSAGSIQKYAGTPVAIASLPLFLVAAVALLPRLERAVSRCSVRLALFAAAAGLLFLAIALVVIYPHVNVHTLGNGSDRDDAADIGARRLLDGEYPYGPLTYLGNPISQLPGALALAAPFVEALGHSAYANVFWLAVLIVVVVVVGRPLPASVAIVAAAIVLSPGVLREYLTGGDLIANTIYVAAASVGVFRLAAHRRSGPLAALALGVTLASRANFSLLLIPLTVALARRYGLRRACALVAVAALTAISLFAVALARPAGRASIRVADHLNVLGHVGSAVTVAIAVALAVVTALRTRHWTASAMLFQAGVVQALFPIALVANASATATRLDFTPLVSGYGVPALLLVLPAGFLLADDDKRSESII